MLAACLGQDCAQATGASASNAHQARFSLAFTACKVDPAHPPEPATFPPRFLVKIPSHALGHLRNPYCQGAQFSRLLLRSLPCTAQNISPSLARSHTIQPLLHPLPVCIKLLCLFQNSRVLIPLCSYLSLSFLCLQPTSPQLWHSALQCKLHAHGT